MQHKRQRVRDSVLGAFKETIGHNAESPFHILVAHEVGVEVIHCSDTSHVLNITVCGA